GSKGSRPEVHRWSDCASNRRAAEFYRASMTSQRSLHPHSQTREIWIEYRTRFGETNLGLIRQYARHPQMDGQAVRYLRQVGAIPFGFPRSMPRLRCRG